MCVYLPTLLNKMDILQLQQGEPFAVGIQVLAQFPLRVLRKLENFTILFVNRGTARIEIDFCTYDIKANCHIGLAADLFLQFLEISPDFTVSYLTFTRDIQFEIDTPFPPPFFAFLKQYPVSPTLPTKEMEKNNQLLQIVYDLYLEKEHTFRLPMLKNCLQNFMMDIYDKTKAQFLHRDAQNTTRQEELLEKFIALVFQHSSSHRDVQFYADQLCITTRYLSSIIQKLTGHTPKEIIDDRCIQEIKMRLRTTNESMQEIAFQLNFPDQSFFSRYFKKHTGITPAEYRQSP